MVTLISQETTKNCSVGERRVSRVEDCCLAGYDRTFCATRQGVDDASTRRNDNSAVGPGV